MSKYDEFDLDVKNTEINNGIEPQAWSSTITGLTICTCDCCSGGPELSVTTPCTSGRLRVI